MLKDIMMQLAKAFPTFVVLKSTDKELGRRLVAILSLGTSFNTEKMLSYTVKQLVLLSGKGMILTLAISYYITSRYIMS